MIRFFSTLNNTIHYKKKKKKHNNITYRKNSVQNDLFAWNNTTQSQLNDKKFLFYSQRTQLLKYGINIMNYTPNKGYFWRVDNFFFLFVITVLTRNVFLKFNEMWTFRKRFFWNSRPYEWRKLAESDSTPFVSTITIEVRRNMKFRTLILL